MKKDEIIWMHLGLLGMLLFTSRYFSYEVLLLVFGLSTMTIRLVDILVTAIKESKSAQTN